MKRTRGCSVYIRVLGLEVVDQWWYSARLAKSDSVIAPCTASGEERKINNVAMFITNIEPENDRSEVDRPYSKMAPNSKFCMHLN